MKIKKNEKGVVLLTTLLISLVILLLIIGLYQRNLMNHKLLAYYTDKRRAEKNLQDLINNHISYELIKDCQILEAKDRGNLSIEHCSKVLNQTEYNYYLLDEISLMDDGSDNVNSFVKLRIIEKYKTTNRELELIYKHDYNSGLEQPPLKIKKMSLRVVRD